MLLKRLPTLIKRLEHYMYKCGAQTTNKDSSKAPRVKCTTIVSQNGLHACAVTLRTSRSSK